MKTRIILASLFLCITCYSPSTLLAKEAWNYSSSMGAPSWTKVAPDGNLIVMVNGTMTLLNHITGKPIWTNQVGGFSEDHVNYKPNTLYLELKSDPMSFAPVSESKQKGGMFGISVGGNSESSNAKVSVFSLSLVDLNSGRTVVNCPHVIRYKILQQSGDVLVYGFFDKDSDPSLALFDSKTGTRQWKSAEIFKKKEAGFNFAFIKVSLDLDPNIMNADPVDLKDNTMLIVLPTGLYKLKLADGKPVWHQELPKLDSYSTGAHIDKDKDPNVKMILSPVDPDTFYYMTSFFICGYKISDGTPVWTEKFPTFYPIDQIIYTPKGMLLNPIVGSGAMFQSADLYYVDYRTGKSLWSKKSLAIKGGVSDYLFLNNGKILLEKEDANKSNSISVLDIDKGVFDFTDVGVDGRIQSVEELDSGYLYSTDHTVNILNHEGKNVIKNPVFSDRFLSLNLPENLYLLDANGNQLYQLDKAKKTISKIAQLAAPEGSEKFDNLELIENTLVASSLRSVSICALDGALQSKHYYKRPGLNGLGKFLGFGIAVLTGPAGILVYGPGAVSQVLTGDFHDSVFAKSFDAQARQSAHNARNLYFMNDPVYQVILKRLQIGESISPYKSISVDFDFFKTTALSVDVLHTKDPLISVMDDTGLAIVNKSDGSMPFLLNIKKTKNPVYAWDNLSKTIYYIQENLIRAYTF